MEKDRSSTRIVITGSSGLIGRALSSFLQEIGYEVVPLLRIQEKHPGSFYWDPVSGRGNVREWEGCEAWIHLAGAPFRAFRWSNAWKQEVYNSRVLSTRKLSQLLLQLKHPPRVFISASAVGYYGNQFEERISEGAPPGTGFLANLCKEWEEATFPLKSRSIRLIQARFGVVLSSKGGLLSTMVPLYQLGLGMNLGAGEQFMSWIALTDLVRALSFCLHAPQLEGPINMVSPQPVRQKEFASILASILKRPRLFSLPEWFIKKGMGEMGKELLLSSQQVFPDKLIRSGFAFRYPSLVTCLQDELLH